MNTVAVLYGITIFLLALMVAIFLGVMLSALRDHLANLRALRAQNRADKRVG